MLKFGVFFLPLFSIRITLREYSTTKGPSGGTVSRNLYFTNRRTNLTQEKYKGKDNPC